MFILLLFNLAYAVMLLVFARSFRNGFRAVKEVSGDLPFVSVVIPVRNEASRLSTLFESLKEQTYPSQKTEWILTDDHSSDTTLALLQQEKDPRLRILTLRDGETGKKAALTAGIRQSNGKWIITTDADCWQEKGWLSAMIAKAESEQAMMVCGLVKVEGDSSASAQFQSMETGVLQVSGAGSLRLGHPLLNTGTSLCFLKQAWEQINGYKGHEHIASGDDTFLMLRFHHQYPGKVHPLITGGAVVATHPAANWREVLQQRIRWNGKVRHYPTGSIHLTGAIVFLSGLLWLAAIPLAVMNVNYSWIFAGIFLLRSLSEAYVLHCWKVVTGQSFSPERMLLMSVFYPIFTLYSLIIRPFMKIEWKGRKV